MPTITIPKNSIKNDELVAVSRSDYNLLIGIKKIREFVPTKAQKKALETAERNFQHGKTLTYNELAKKLGFTN